ncbi:MAG: hypothetical protein GXO71_04450 [Caldiserica bacterium]|nr:hypothetical protein [Caldisericota bacterium]
MFRRKPLEERDPFPEITRWAERAEASRIHEKLEREESAGEIIGRWLPKVFLRIISLSLALIGISTFIFTPFLSLLILGIAVVIFVIVG